jgi:hypothetical protein
MKWPVTAAVKLPNVARSAGGLEMAGPPPVALREFSWQPDDRDTSDVGRVDDHVRLPQ